MYTGFNNDKYLYLQQKAIQDRIDNFPSGKLYLEVGGHFLHDDHAARVLPGYDPEAKKQLFQGFRGQADIIYCVNYDDILHDRKLPNRDSGFQEIIISALNRIEKDLGIHSHVAINLCPEDTSPLHDFVEKLQQQKYQTYYRYLVSGYPDKVDLILSEQGFGRDDYIKTDKNLIFVSSIASNSGKFSTCLGQLWHDYQHGLSSGYAKFETFPIHSLPLDHPINLAYEAATVDIGDYNLIDPYHKETYGVEAVNYNRDVAAFPILKKLTEFLPPDNFMHQYKSPTDMGLNMAGLAIVDDAAVQKAARKEIISRYDYHQKNHPEHQNWLGKLQQLLDKTTA